ncbi:hypothetical protein HNP99_001809 [Flavobacterium sp. 28A]|uniref:DUF6913 domain-containing protein n=1 Tax=Flavobacterium sp. 28A TaxID=2735895 RepID=UPI00157042E4|nr:hypothetical protein [Flavobacterium sp. 28A]NRT15452.1 hypothetical protein [Flavobacterium sp. 28A]
MFLSFIKDFSVKRILKNSLQNVKGKTVAGTVKTVGLLLDLNCFFEIQKILDALTSQGVLKENISVLIFSNKKSVSASHPTFGSKNLNWNGELNGAAASSFMNKEFDLLISYYEQERPTLLATTLFSKAHFKVGFANSNKHLNDLTINTKTENYLVFIQELFRYLKILNKI